MYRLNFRITALRGIDCVCSVYASLTGFMNPEYALKRRSNHFEIHLELTSKNSLQDFIAVVRKLGLKIDDVELTTAYMNSGLYVYSIALTIVSGEFKKAVRHDDIIPRFHIKKKCIS